MPAPGPVAVVVVRAGRLAPGGAETVAEALDGGDARVVLVGEGASSAADELTGLSGLSGLVPAVEVVPFDRFAPAAWARALAPGLRTSAFVVLPASAGGRDLAPRLAAELGWPLLANAVAVSQGCVVVSRQGGLVQTTIVPGAPFVATLEPGVRGTTVAPSAPPPRVVELALELDPSTRDAEVLEVLPPDVATMDLAEAPRIVGGGAGLMAGEDDAVAQRFDRLAAVGEAIGASMGATRVVTDAGWVPHQRQIGTTGVVVDPRLYVAFAISGAVQRTAGLGRPDHVISVNVDPHCPMMAMADLAVVADANATLDALADRLGVAAPEHADV
jgi:electron transfer flavoprotein alpha subunit